jgi:hypothetical protein
LSLGGGGLLYPFLSLERFAVFLSFGCVPDELEPGLGGLMLRLAWMGEMRKEERDFFFSSWFLARARARDHLSGSLGFVVQLWDG